jgi:hypothetical protein
MSLEDVSGRPDDLRRADDANRGIPYDPHEQAMTEIVASSMIRAPLGNMPPGDPYGRSNAIVYLLAGFGLLPIVFFLFAPAALIVATVRVVRHERYAWRGLVVALVVLALGIVRLVAANT